MICKATRVLLLAALTALPAAAMGGNVLEAMNRKVAGRVFLSSGDILEVAYSNAHGGTEITLLARDTSSGVVFSVTEKTDYAWSHLETTISDGKTLLEFRTDWGYNLDKLPTPLQVKIGKDVYRVLLKRNALTDDQKRMQEAVAKLPAPFVAGIKHLIPIGDMPGFSVDSLDMAKTFFDGPSEIQVGMVKKMEPAEIDALLRDATK